MAFPCNQFLMQEPGTSQHAEEFACTRYKAEYPIFGKVCYAAGCLCRASGSFADSFYVLEYFLSLLLSGNMSYCISLNTCLLIYPTCPFRTVQNCDPGIRGRIDYNCHLDSYM